MSVERTQERRRLVEIETEFDWQIGEMPRKKGGVRKSLSARIEIDTNFYEDRRGYIEHIVRASHTETTISNGGTKKIRTGASLHYAFDKIFVGGIDSERQIFRISSAEKAAGLPYEADTVIDLFGHFADVLCEQRKIPAEATQEDAAEALKRTRYSLERQKIDTPDVKTGGGGKTGKPRV